MNDLDTAETDILDSDIVTPDQFGFVVKYINKLKGEHKKVKFDKIFSTKLSFDSSAQNFHQSCDDKAPTLVLVKDTDGNVFGGFTNLSWDCPEEYQYKGGDPESFLFSVNKKKIIKHDNNIDSKSIHCDVNWGPAYGYGDLVIENMCTLSNDSWTELKKSYGRFDNEIDEYFLTNGKNKFQVEILEVFYVDTRE